MSKPFSPTRHKNLVLALDPGYERLGIAVLEATADGKQKLLHSECFRTKATLPFTERLLRIGLRVEELLHTHQPEKFALEKLFFSTNRKTAMRVAEVRGTLLYIAARNKLRIYEYTPAEVKIAVTGYGKSDKRQIMEMLPRLIHIEKSAKLDDEFDAIAIGITCLVSERSG